MSKPVRVLLVGPADWRERVREACKGSPFEVLGLGLDDMAAAGQEVAGLAIVACQGRPPDGWQSRQKAFDACARSVCLVSLDDRAIDRGLDWPDHWREVQTADVTGAFLKGFLMHARVPDNPGAPPPGAKPRLKDFVDRTNKLLDDWKRQAGSDPRHRHFQMMKDGILDGLGESMSLAEAASGHRSDIATELRLAVDTVHLHIAGREGAFPGEALRGGKEYLTAIHGRLLLCLFLQLLADLPVQGRMTAPGIKRRGEEIQVRFRARLPQDAQLRHQMPECGVRLLADGQATVLAFPPASS